MIEYVKTVVTSALSSTKPVVISALSSIVKIPVFFFIVAEAVFGSLVNAMFQYIADGDFGDEDEYPNLQSDDGLDSDSSVKIVNLERLDSWDLGDEDNKSVNQAVLTDSRKGATSEDPVEKRFEQEGTGSGSAGVDFNFDPWIEVNNPGSLHDSFSAELIGGGGVIGDEDCDTDIETLD